MTVDAYLAPLRVQWRGFRGNFYILCAIRAIIDDDSLTNHAKVAIIGQVLDEGGWESGQDVATLYLTTSDSANRRTRRGR